MKRFSLSGSRERITGSLIAVFLLVCMGLLIAALRTDVLSLIICVVASFLVAGGLVFYLVNLYRAQCIVSRESKDLDIRGIPDYKLNISGAVSLKTGEFKAGPVVTRIVIFSDGEGNVVATLPTFFTADQGAQAEPMTMELAAALGLKFEPTLEKWQYDAQARREHSKAVAEEEKHRRKENFQALKAKLLRKPLVQEAPAQEEAGFEYEEEMSDGGINYDILDDVK